MVKFVKFVKWQDQFGDYDENEVKTIDEKIHLSHETLKQLQQTLQIQESGESH